MSTKKIYFVRHGETDANLHEYVPYKNEPLNEKGLIQADVFAERVAHIDFKKVFVSDYLRAQQTAATILKLKNYTPVIESAFGEFTEPSSLYGAGDKDERVISYRKNRNAQVENQQWRQEDGETFYDIFERIKRAKKLLEDDTSESILVVSHSFFLMLFVATVLLKAECPTNSWLQVARTLRVSNTGVTLCTLNEGVWKLVMWNDHAHFAE